jgi:hypothetical protein
MGHNDFRKYETLLGQRRLQTILSQTTTPTMRSTMQLLFNAYGPIVIISTFIYVTKAIEWDDSRIPLQKQRILQGFGVVSANVNSSTGSGGDNFGVGGVAPTINKSPTARPMLSPIFSPASSASRPIFAPIKSPSFGNSGVTIDNEAPVAPSMTPRAPSAAPSTSGSDDLEFPTSLPTSISGIVIGDTPSNEVKPTKSPVTMQNNQVPKTWLSFVVTYTSQMYTIVQDSAGVGEILRKVHGDIRHSLQRLVTLQNVSITITMLESELLGTMKDLAILQLLSLLFVVHVHN